LEKMQMMDAQRRLMAISERHRLLEKLSR
jgi:hypothetical protein